MKNLRIHDKIKVAPPVVIFLPIRRKLLKSLQNGAKVSIITYTEYKIDIKVKKGVINPQSLKIWAVFLP